MKLLENNSFERLSDALTTEDSMDGRIDARIESYSCKMTQDDKKALGRMTHRRRGVSPHDLAALSPPTTSQTPAPRQRTWSTSSNNEDQLVGACSRKTLFYLISTLNQSYGTDYDFSSVKSDEFSHEPSCTWVKNFIDSSLTAALSNKFTPQMRNQLWSAVEKEINLTECDIFSFNPDKDPNDEDELCMWSFTFFFFNKRLKRIVMFLVRSVCTTFEEYEDYQSQDSIDFQNTG